MKKQSVQTQNAPKAIGPYAQAVQTGTLLYTSGQLGIDMQTGALAQGVEQQAQCAMRNLGEILKEKGLGYGDIIKTTVFVVDLADFAVVNRVYGSFFDQGDYPARSCVQVAALPLGGLLEIECVAAL